ncbi:MAG: sulfite exporter TauE/SafE family protein [Amphritea sp.]
MLVELTVITLGSFFAALVNAAFATGGIYILLATSSSVFPLAVAIPLQSAFSFSSLLARISLFWVHIRWPIVAAFVIGATGGVYFGTHILISLDEATIALMLGVLLLTFAWFPRVKWRVPIKHPFFIVGTIHSFISTLFGVGGVLQSAVLRTNLLKANITGTLAACLISMDILKITGYVSVGFDYRDYLYHILLATVAGFTGAWTGKRLSHRVSEQLFRQVFRWLLTAVAFRMLYRGLM